MAVEDLGHGPVSTASPEYITQMRSQTSSTRPRLWLMNSIEVPYFSPSALTRSTIPASTVTSSAVVGSSRIRSAGLAISAMAMTMRCCWPPDSWCG
jgi:hypothetical protein